MLGTAVRSPAVLPENVVVHDALGKPSFEFSAELTYYLTTRGLTAHLSLSDDRDNVVAIVILEQR